MRIIPIDSRLLIKLSDKDRYQGTLIIPETARQRTRVFEVLDVGDGVTKFKIGDKVLISFYTGIFIDLISTVDPENLRMVDEDEVLAKLEE